MQLSVRYLNSAVIVPAMQVFGRQGRRSEYWCAFHLVVSVFLSLVVAVDCVIHV